jgi:hypothetical protein
MKNKAPSIPKRTRYVLIAVLWNRRYKRHVRILLSAGEASLAVRAFTWPGGEFELVRLINPELSLFH